jgi:uncharacterized protein with ParB-like and HNH nuclease domain
MKDNKQTKRTFDSIFKPMPFTTEGIINLFGVDEGFNGRPDDPDRKWVIPDYQRGSSWTVQQASLFVGNMITGGICPPCWLNRNLHKDEMEILDGQQRLTSLYQWTCGNIPAIDPVGGEYIYVNEFDEKNLRRLYYKTEVKVMYVDLSRTEQLALYLRLNAGGTPHSTEEIQRVRDLLAGVQGRMVT